MLLSLQRQTNMAKKKQSYNEAMAEIELILHKIESGELDVDDLTENVMRIAELIKLCKNKLSKTDEEIQKILEEIK